MIFDVIFITHFFLKHKLSRSSNSITVLGGPGVDELNWVLPAGLEGYENPPIPPGNPFRLQWLALLWGKEVLNNRVI